MTEPSAARSFLVGEVEALEPFDFVAVIPSGRPLDIIEATRGEDGTLEIRVPGRIPIAPELPVGVRSALRDRGFSSEDPADQTKPWVRDVSDPETCVKTMQDVLVEAFGAKPDAKLDIAHGSHRVEYEAKKRLALARKRIESVVTAMLGRTPSQDGDGDYVLPIEGVHVMVAPRATPSGQVVVRVFVITNVGINVAPELGLILARLNFGLMFGRFALDAENRSIWFDETILGEEFREEELRFAISTVAATADEWDDRLKQMFGGVTYQEFLAGRDAAAPPPPKPGGGVGLYL